jgi:hypothetical protein
MDKPHVPPPYMDRSFTGAQIMLSRKSAEEAPTVSEYDYGNVGTFHMLEGMTTDFDLLGKTQMMTSIYGHVGKEKPTYDPTTLLNDACFCVMTDDGGKLYTILTMLKNELGIEKPASFPYETMFGTTTLMEKITDSELKIPHGKRQDAMTLLRRFS